MCTGRLSNRLLSLAMTAGLLLSASSAGAHALGQSYVFLKVQQNSLSGQVQLNITDINKIFGTDLPTKAPVDRALFVPHIDKIKAYMGPRLSLKTEGGKTLPIRYTDFDFVDELSFAVFLQLKFEVGGVEDGVPQKIVTFYDGVFEVENGHRAFLVVTDHWETGTIGNWEIPKFAYTANNKTRTLDLSDGSLMTGFITMVEQGIEHIWIGIDHILFLIALIIPAVLVRVDGAWKPVERFKPAMIQVLKVVTMFTVAHSITLSVASLEILTLPSRLVESIIALSIALVAFDIIKPIFGKRMWIVVFVFGLFHGFGFASVLAEIGLGKNHLVLSLLGFNLGVEIGQAVIIAACFPVLYMLRNVDAYSRVIVRYASVALIAVALVWLTERALDVNITGTVYWSLRNLLT